MTTAYYVTMQREVKDGIKTAWLLGPFADHDAAKARVKEASLEAEKHDPRAFWDAFGTSSITRDADLSTFPKGVLNPFIPIP